MNHLPSINVSVANMCSGPSFERRCFGLVHAFSIPSCILSKNTRKFGESEVLGSGGLTIGQAGEFDYSGSQAIKALTLGHFKSKFGRIN